MSLDQTSRDGSPFRNTNTAGTCSPLAGLPAPHHLPLVHSICTGAGLLDRAFLDAGLEVLPVAEVDPRMRAMHVALCGGDAPLFTDLRDALPPSRPDGVIGGPPCQAHSVTRAMRAPKFPDLTPAVVRYLELAQPRWFLFENVAPLDIPGAQHIRLDAMHFARPHQSRARWFTYSANIAPPQPLYTGTVDELMAYPAVAARIYGPKRGAVLQGYPAFSALPFPCAQLQLGLANAVPYPLALAWARAILTSLYS